MKKIEFNASAVWESNQALTEMQWSAIGGNLRPDQAVAFILQSEKIRKRLISALLDLESLTHEANEGSL